LTSIVSSSTCFSYIPSLTTYSSSPSALPASSSTSSSTSSTALSLSGVSFSSVPFVSPALAHPLTTTMKTVNVNNNTNLLMFSLLIFYPENLTSLCTFKTSFNDWTLTNPPCPVMFYLI